MHKAHNKETGILLKQIRHLRAQLFGRKSEKIQSGPQTLPLFDMPEPVEEDEAEEKVHIPAYKRKKRGRKPLLYRMLGVCPVKARVKKAKAAVVARR